MAKKIALVVGLCLVCVGAGFLAGCLATNSTGGSDAELARYRDLAAQLTAERDRARADLEATRNGLADYKREIGERFESFISTVEGSLGLVGETAGDLRRALDLVRKGLEIAGRIEN